MSIPLPLGTTRTVLRRDHALIAPDSHVPSVLPGWTKTTAFLLVGPGMGARLKQSLLVLEPGAEGRGACGGEEFFLYSLEGGIRVNSTILQPGSYAWLPPGGDFEVHAPDGGRLLSFAKRYEPVALAPVPEFLTGRVAEVPEQPFLGDPAARLQALLPDELGFDMAVNIFTYDPGATLPFVECHVMEHGLLFLEGAGVYRLGEAWYPVQAGDVIWMAPYCPQWFVASGKTPSRYIYYKDVNRRPHLP